MKMKKVLALVLCAILLVAGSVLGTLAYLTSTTGVVENTFTAGNVEITLDEAKTDEYGVVDATAGRVQGNEYKLIPGHTYAKDPTVHVDDESEDCWLFVQVVNGLDGNEGENTIAAQMAADDNWTLVDGTSNVYAYKEIVSAGADVVVFNTFTLSGDANVEALVDASITIQAYAVQSDGFGTAAAAWAASPLAAWQ